MREAIERVIAELEVLRVTEEPEDYDIIEISCNETYNNGLDQAISRLKAVLAEHENNNPGDASQPE